MLYTNNYDRVLINSMGKKKTHQTHIIYMRIDTLCHVYIQIYKETKKKKKRKKNRVNNP